MKVVTVFNTISKQVVKRANEIKKLEYDINAGATSTGVWVQLHDFPTPADLAAGNTAPANGSVPVKSWNSAAGSPNNYKDFTRGELSFKWGIFVCVSTTEATLTIGTVNNKFDMVSAECYNEEITGTTEAQATDVGSNVWINGSSHQVIRMAATNLEAGVRYLMLFATGASDLPANGDKPLRQYTLAATGDGAGKDTIEINFSGEQALGGFIPYSQTAAYAQQTGFAWYLSSTAKVLTAVIGAGANVYVEYK